MLSNIICRYYPKHLRQEIRLKISKEYKIIIFFADKTMYLENQTNL